MKLYKNTAECARQNGELDEYRASHWESIACKNAIEDEIAKNFDGMHLNPAYLQEVLRQYDSERVAFILATTVQNKLWDGRFRPSNKAWASGIPGTAEPDKKWEYQVSTHPAVLDGFIQLFRKEIEK